MILNTKISLLGKTVQLSNIDLNSLLDQKRHERLLVVSSKLSEQMQEKFVFRIVHEIIVGGRASRETRWRGLTHVDKVRRSCLTEDLVHEYSCWSTLKSTHVKCWTQSTTNFFDCCGQVGKVVVKVVESTRCRRSRTATDADFSVESTTEWQRQPSDSDNRVTAFLWYRRCITVQLHDVDSDLLDNVCFLTVCTVCS